MYPIDIYDALEIHESPKFSFRQSGRVLDNAPEDNIIVKAYRLLQTKIKGLPNLHVHLLKNIPFGAGLGGGSADAAFFMNEICKRYCPDVSMSTIREWAAEIGSDCPFFIGLGAQLATGRGEILDHLDFFNLDDSGPFDIQVIVPKVHISTAKAYSLVKPKAPTYNLVEVMQSDIHSWSDILKNDFEDSVFTQEPNIANIKKQLYEQGAIYASLSGSGSSLYGIFPKNKKANIISDIGFEEFIC